MSRIVDSEGIELDALHGLREALQEQNVGPDASHIVPTRIM